MSTRRRFRLRRRTRRKQARSFLASFVERWEVRILTRFSAKQTRSSADRCSAAVNTKQQTRHEAVSSSISSLSPSLRQWWEAEKNVEALPRLKLKRTSAFLLRAGMLLQAPSALAKGTIRSRFHGLYWMRSWCRWMICLHDSIHY